MLTSTLALAQNPRWTCQTSRVHGVVRTSKRWEYFWDELGFPPRSQIAQAVSLFKMTLKLQSATLAHSAPDGSSLSSSSSALPRLKAVNYREIKSPVKKSLCLKHNWSLPRSSCFLPETGTAETQHSFSLKLTVTQSCKIPVFETYLST